MKTRPDGWPLCPVCGQDELYSLAAPPTISTIAGCYRCGPWERYPPPAPALGLKFKLPDWLIVTLARLERQHGRARLLLGNERIAWLKLLGVERNHVAIELEWQRRYVTMAPLEREERHHDLNDPCS